MNAYYIYLIGMVVTTLLFYFGAVRGGSKNPGLAASLFGVFWFITIPIFFVMLIKSFKVEK